MQKLPDGNKITDYCHSKHFSCLDFMLNTLELRPLAKSVDDNLWSTLMYIRRLKPRLIFRTNCTICKD